MEKVTGVILGSVVTCGRLTTSVREDGGRRTNREVVGKGKCLVVTSTLKDSCPCFFSVMLIYYLKQELNFSIVESLLTFCLREKTQKHMWIPQGPE